MIPAELRCKGVMQNEETKGIESVVKRNADRKRDRKSER